MLKNNPELAVILLVGFFLMSYVISVQMKWYGVARWKSVVVSLVLVFTGIYGSQLWFYVENGYFYGKSFYGVIFLAPLVYLPVAWILRTPYGQLMDFCAPAGCLTLALVKIRCLRSGCCEGFIMGVDESYRYIKFPSQIVEMTAFLIISGILFWMTTKEKYRTKIFPWFLVLYGGSRFVLNFFRAETAPFALGLTAGSFWSVWAVLIGLVWLRILRRKTAGGNEKVYNI